MPRIGLAIFTFSILGIGQNVVGENEGVAELFLYAGATGVLLWLSCTCRRTALRTGSAAGAEPEGQPSDSPRIVNARSGATTGLISISE